MHCRPTALPGHQARPWALAAVLVAALGLSGCGRDEAASLAEVRARLAQPAQLNQAGPLTELKGLTQKFPRSGEAHYLLGWLLHQRGEWREATLALDRARELRYDANLLLPLLARTLVMGGKPRRVVDELSGQTLTDPKAQAELVATLAAALARDGQAPRARQTLTEALAQPGQAQAEPLMLAQAKLATATGQWPEALTATEALLSRHPGSDEGWALKGDLLLRQPQGQAEAMAAYRMALQARPSQLHARAALVSLQLAQGQPAAAEQDLVQLRQHAPGHFSTDYLEARLAAAKGDTVRARGLYNKLVKTAPDHPLLLVSAAENELRLQAYGQAETLASKALTLTPGDNAARRVVVQALLRKGQAGRAVVMLGPLVEKPDAPAELLALAAQAQLANDNPKAAEVLYARLARLRPSDARLRTLAVGLGGLRPTSEALVAELQQVAADDPGITADLAIVDARLRAKQWDAALKTIDTIAQKQPRQALPQQLRAHVLAQRGDLAGARSALESAVAAQPLDLSAIEALARLDLLAKRPDDARQRFQQVLAQQPHNAAALLALAGVARQAQAGPAELLGILNRAVAADAQHAAAHLALIDHHLQHGDPAAALAAATAAAEALPDNTDMLERQARMQLANQKVDQALVTYGRIASLQNRSVVGHLGQAQAHLQVNNLTQAQRAVERALDREPQSPDAQALMVAVLVGQKRFQEAADLARSMQLERPQHARGWQVQAEVAGAQGQWEAAVKALQQAVAKPEGAAGASLALYIALAKAGQNSEAEAFAERWLQQHPHDRRFLFQAASAAQQANQPARAERLYQQLLALAPDHPFALNNLALLHLAQGKPDALALADRAVKLMPEHALLLDTQAEARAAAGQMDQALQAQQRAATLAPQSAAVRLKLVKLMVKAGEPRDARNELNRLAEAGLTMTEAQRQELVDMRQSLGRP